MNKWSSLALAVTLGAVLTLSGCGGNNNASTESTAGAIQRQLPHRKALLILRQRHRIH